MHYPVPPQPLLSSRGVSGRHKAGGWRERQTRAPQVLTTKGMDCEITPGLDNLPPHWNPWGTEIINLLISYTSLFPFFLEKKKKKSNCKWPSYQVPVSVTWRPTMLWKKYTLYLHGNGCSQVRSPPLPPQPFPPGPGEGGCGEHVETDSFWRGRVFFQPQHRACPSPLSFLAFGPL